MRWYPQSIANRTVSVLILGLILIMVLSIGISRLVSQGDTDYADRWHIFEQVKLITQIVNNAKPEQRKELIALIRNEYLNINWLSTTNPPQRLEQHWGTKKIAEHLMRHLRDLNIRNIISGHPPDTTTAMQANALDNKSPITVYIQLEDDSWLNFTASLPPHKGAWFLRLLTWLIVFGGGITLLVVMVTRRIIRPLQLFAAASQQFGLDVNAPSLPEHGPTEIKQAAIAFNKMQTRIRNFVQERMQMIAAISHDLKTPITRLRLRSDYIQDDKQRQKALDDLSDMQTILDSTLSFAREDTNQEPRIDVDLNALLQSITDDMHDAGHQVELESAKKVIYHCAPVAIRRALNNLINNAVQYGHYAKIDLNQSPANIDIHISDNGPGIPDSDMQHVFTPFYRVEKSRNRDTGGAGLGLTVAKTIIRQHGGDIELINRKQGGLQVKITLPLQ